MNGIRRRKGVKPRNFPTINLNHKKKNTSYTPYSKVVSWNSWSCLGILFRLLYSRLFPISTINTQIIPSCIIWYFLFVYQQSLRQNYRHLCWLVISKSLKISSLSREHFLTWWSWLLSQFLSVSVMYCQVDGISMGSPLGLFMVNIFVWFREKQLFDKVLLRSLCWWYFCFF